MSAPPTITSGPTDCCSRTRAARIASEAAPLPSESATHSVIASVRKPWLGNNASRVLEPVEKSLSSASSVRAVVTQPTWALSRRRVSSRESLELHGLLEVDDADLSFAVCVSVTTDSTTDLEILFVVVAVWDARRWGVRRRWLWRVDEGAGESAIAVAVGERVDGSSKRKVC